MMITHAQEQRSSIVLYRFTHAIILILTIALVGFAQVSASYVGGILHPPDVHHEIGRAPMSAVVADEMPPKADDDGKALLPWFCGGTLVGGFICVGARALATVGQTARYFGVSVSVGLLCGIITVLGLPGYFPNPRWYHAFSVTGAYAGGAWFLIELATFACAGVMTAAKERGIVGIRDQFVFLLTLGTVNNNPKPPVNPVDTHDVSPAAAPPVVKYDKPL